MDTKTYVLVLQIITLLDSISYGLVYCFLSPYIQSLGADHFVVGVLAVGNLLCNLLSVDVINTFTQIHGKRYTLCMIFNTALVTHLIMLLTQNYWYTIFARYIFSLTNQSQKLCKSLLLEKVPENEQEQVLLKFSILSSTGYIIGPLISGYLFSSGFGYICLLAVILTFINTLLIMTVPMRTNESSNHERTVIERRQNNLYEIIHHCTNCGYKKNWDIITVKYLYMSSIIIFSSKFTQILKHNFEASPFDIGYTYAYMNSLTFAGTYFASNIKNELLNNISITMLVEYALLVAGGSLIIACYSPVYLLYEAMCVPIIFATNVLSNSWKDFFATRGNDSLNEINRSVEIISGLTAPLMFGVVCNIIGHHAAILFSVIPIFISLYIINIYTKYVSLRETYNYKED